MSLGATDRSRTGSVWERVDKDVITTFVPEAPDDRERRARVVWLLAVGVARLLVGEGTVKAGVDLSADVRVTTTIARRGGGDES